MHRRRVRFGDTRRRCARRGEAVPVLRVQEEIRAQRSPRLAHENPPQAWYVAPLFPAYPTLVRGVDATESRCQARCLLAHSQPTLACTRSTRPPPRSLPTQTATLPVTTPNTNTSTPRARTQLWKSPNQTANRTHLTTATIHPSPTRQPIRDQHPTMGVHFQPITSR